MDYLKKFPVSEKFIFSYLLFTLLDDIFWSSLYPSLLNSSPSVYIIRFHVIMKVISDESDGKANDDMEGDMSSCKLMTRYEKREDASELQSSDQQSKRSFRLWILDLHISERNLFNIIKSIPVVGQVYGFFQRNHLFCKW